MESEQVLQHYGILGQKWGIRRYQNPDGTLTPAGKKKYRYQNPDGSLTEEGKKDYMTAARKGKLDPRKLSDADLNMINTRFAKEKTYAQNVEGYQKSTFKYRLQEAVINRIKGNGGGGGGGKKGGGGGKGLGSILATPIKKAFEDAFKESKDNGKDDDYDDTMDQWWKDVSKKGHRLVDKYFDPTKQHDIERTKEDTERGKKHMEFVFNSTSGGRAGTYDSTANGNSYMEKKLRERQEAKRAEQARRAADRDKENRRQKKEASKRRKERELEERLSKSGLILGHSAFVIHRIGDDELMHHGIKGQRWGVRRYQNEDGTLTEAGRQRYMYDLGSGRKMSLIGKIKFSKEIRQKTEADEREKFKKTKQFIDDIDSRSESMKNSMKNYDKMDPESRKKFGNEVLDEIDACDDWFMNPDNFGKDTEHASVEEHRNALDNWIFQQVKTKSGVSWDGTSVSEGHRKALAEYNVAKNSGDRKKKYLAGHKLVSVGLRDIGFEDTKENRKRCWQYFFEDYYPWGNYDP